jgi:hypothetical protein
VRVQRKGNFGADNCVDLAESIVQIRMRDHCRVIGKFGQAAKATAAATRYRTR